MQVVLLFKVFAALLWSRHAKKKGYSLQVQNEILIRLAYTTIMGQPCPQRGVGWRRTLLEEIRVKKGVLAESHLIKKLMDEGESSLIKPLVRESP